MYVVHVDRQRSLHGPDPARPARGGCPARRRPPGRRDRASRAASSRAAPGARRRGDGAADARRRALRLDPARRRARCAAAASTCSTATAVATRCSRFAVARLAARAAPAAHQAQPHAAARPAQLARRTAHCDRVVTVSEFVRDALVDAGLEPARVVSDPDRRRPRALPAAPARSGAARGARSASAPDELVIGNVSSLHRRKGIEELLRAYRAAAPRSARRAAARVCWSARRCEQWQPLARELGIADRVLFPGFREDVAASCCRSSTSTCCRRDHEALGTGALEAMAVGAARSWSSDVGGARRGGRAGHRACACRPATRERLAGAIESPAGDPARRRALGAAARARSAWRSTTAQVLAARMLALYEEVVQRGGASADA